MPDEGQAVPSGATGSDEEQSKDVIAERNTKAEQDRINNTDVWICLDCGKQYPKAVPENGCSCGNLDNMGFRLKEKVDFEDEAAGRPLHGVKNEAPEAKAEALPAGEGEASQSKEIKAPAGDNSESATVKQPIEPGTEGQVEGSGDTPPDYRETDPTVKKGDDPKEVSIPDEELMKDDGEEPQSEVAPT